MPAALPIDDGPSVAATSPRSPGAPRSLAIPPRRAERLVEHFTRVALGAAFLSAVASRFGSWGGGPGRFAEFERYAAEVLAYAPAAAIPFLARAATVAELGLGAALVLGIWRRPVALASTLLLATFGVAMGVSLGLQAPLDYSVFSAAGAALLLALRTSAPSDDSDVP